MSYKFSAKNTVGSGAYSVIKSHSSKEVLLITRSQVKIDFYNALGLLRGAQYDCRLTYNRIYSNHETVNRLAVPIARLYKPTHYEFMTIENEFRDFYYSKGYRYISSINKIDLSEYPILAPLFRFLITFEEHAAARINWDFKQSNVMVTKDRKIIPLDVVNLDAMFGYPDGIDDQQYS